MIVPADDQAKRHSVRIFDDPDYVKDYDRNLKCMSGADLEPILRHSLKQLEGVRCPRVLELGSGPGWLGLHLAGRREDMTLTGVDLSTVCVERANANAVAERLSDRVVFQQGNALDLSVWQEGAFDAVISNQTIHYWDPAPQVIGEIHRVLKPGGFFCIGDDRRDMTLAASFTVFVSKWFLAKTIRVSWMESISECFTIREIRDMFDQSPFQESWQLQVCQRMFYAHGKK